MLHKQFYLKRKNKIYNPGDYKYLTETENIYKNPLQKILLIPNNALSFRQDYKN